MSDMEGMAPLKTVKPLTATHKKKSPGKHRQPRRRLPDYSNSVNPSHLGDTLKRSERARRRLRGASAQAKPRTRDAPKPSTHKASRKTPQTRDTIPSQAAGIRLRRSRAAPP
ncbi:hypothetical protein MyNCGM121_14720 [Achromobacter xylosoxidans]